ncbi:hypothetical protein CASFOL_042548 [Castilleja foliolosa]|uniref:Uncharacterized protein n=1 Tax=Castilleja foliolosa TaxID=1961234 RepID=A0ABD3B8V9_9LAMI
MGSPSPDDSSQKAIEGDLVETGERLLAIPSSTIELLKLLEKSASLLAKVWQQPPVSTCFSLLPTMKALVTDEVLRHKDVDVHVAVASCFNELTRITCPDPPYDDDVMMDFFRLFMVAFRQLSSCESDGQNYSRALLILETMAKVRSFLMLLDIDSDGLIVEMFQLFLTIVKSNHQSDVLKHMEMIMSTVIEESDEISCELLRPLLASVKMENKNSSPVSWELGKKVFENCATKLPSYLRAAVKEMSLVLADYAVIVTSICHFISHNNPNGKNTVSNKVTPTVGDKLFQLNGVSEPVHYHRDPQTNDGKTKSNNENSLETLKGCESGALRRRRGRKANSVIRPEEGYQHVLMIGSKYSDELSSDDYNEENDDLALVSVNSSKKKTQSCNEINLSERHQLKKERTINHPGDLKVSSTVKRKTGKRAIDDLSNVRVKKGKGILGEYEDEKQETRKTQKCVGIDGVSKKSKRPRVDYGEELVSLRIQVWWPMDEIFYSGTVTAFDREAKKHTILYDDDETEILNLRKEKWKLCADKHSPQPFQKEEADHQSHPQQSVKILKKTTNRRTVSPKQPRADSSPKRSKGEECGGVVKCLENSQQDFLSFNDESFTKALETSKADGDSHQESEMLLEIMKNGPEEDVQ